LASEIMPASATTVTSGSLWAAMNFPLTGTAGRPVAHAHPRHQQARKVLELTFREARRMGHTYIGTEHILLALAEFENGTEVLADLGIDKAAAEAHITAAVAAALAVRDRNNRPGGAGARPAIPASLIAAVAGPTCQPLPPESHRISHPQPAPSAGSPDHPNLHPRHALPAR
jgi:hypothetical protein